MIVVDIGCRKTAWEDSIPWLAERYKPETLYAFDPYPELVEETYYLNGAKVVVQRKAAWTRDGYITYTEAGSGSRVNTPSSVLVPCFDLVAWLEPIADGAVVKFDCEGAEYALLNALVKADLDKYLKEVLVEWHDDPDYTLRQRYLDYIRCPVLDYGCA